jgi:flagellar assembly protein FliH
VATVSSNAGGSKENFPAWERWHPGALHPERRQERAAPLPPEVIERRAHAAGFEQGRQAGLKAGFQAGYNEGRAHAQAEAAQIHAVAQAAQQALQGLGDTLAHKTVALASAIAQKILQREIQSCPDSMLDVVRDALTLLPDSSGRVRIIVNTADAALIGEAMSANPHLPECLVVGADDMQRGGCRIVAAGGDIDATLATRVSRVLAALGVQDELQP